MEEDLQEIKDHVPTPTNYLEKVDGVPNFWAVCVKNNKMMQQIIRDRDNVPLESVSDVRIEESLDKKKKQIKITLCFNDNDFFENKELTVKVYYDKEGDLASHTEGTPI